MECFIYGLIHVVRDVGYCILIRSHVACLFILQCLEYVAIVAFVAEHQGVEVNPLARHGEVYLIATQAYVVPALGQRHERLNHGADARQQQVVNTTINLFRQGGGVATILIPYLYDAGHALRPEQYVAPFYVDSSGETAGEWVVGEMLDGGRQQGGKQVVEPITKRERTLRINAVDKLF